jgi:CBS domain-containing protein
MKEDKAARVEDRLAELISHRDPHITRRPATPILDQQSRLIGIITRGAVVRTLEGGANGTTVLDGGSRDLIVAFPNKLLHNVIVKVLRNDVGRLTVVSRDDVRQHSGYLGRANLITARLRRVDEEQVRESGLLAEA